MKLYKVRDSDHYFRNGEPFKSTEEARKALASYHSIDWTAEKFIELLTLDELLEHGQQEIEEVEGISCPLCDAGIEHTNHKKADLWACKDCCFVGFEFYGNNNLQDLINYLNK